MHAGLFPDEYDAVDYRLLEVESAVAVLDRTIPRGVDHELDKKLLLMRAALVDVRATLNNRRRDS